MDRITDPADAVYHANYHGRHGYLATIDRALTFWDTTTDDLLVVTPPMVNALVTDARLGQPLACWARQQMRGSHAYLDVQMGN